MSKHYSHSDDELREIAKKYNSKKEWRTDNLPTYQQAHRVGKEFWGEITSHMTPFYVTYSEDELREIALKYTKKIDWFREDWPAYNQTIKKGKEFFDEVSNHLKMRNKRTDDELREIALKYKQKKEWEIDDQPTYQQGYRKGKEFFDDITNHMVGNNERYGVKDIYVFEFLEKGTPKAAYVGLTCDINRRKTEHETGECKYHNNESTSAVFKFQQKNPHLTLNFQILTDEKVKPSEAVKLESYWVEKYKEDGWLMLNIKSAGSLGMKRINSNDDLRKIAKKYKKKQEWRDKDNKTYNQAKIRGREFFIDVTNHMEKLHYSHSDDELREIAKKYNTKKEWKTDDSGSAQQAYKRGKEFWDDITNHMVSGYLGHYHNSEDELREIALKYNTLKEWRKVDSSTYTQSINRGKEFFVNITSHMVKTRKKFSKDELRNIAKKYNNQVEWRKEDGKTFQQSKMIGKGFLKDVTNHMGTLKRGRYSDDDLRKISKNYNSKKEWRENSSGSYQVAYRRGKEFWDDVTSHMF